MVLTSVATSTLVGSHPGTLFTAICKFILSSYSTQCTKLRLVTMYQPLYLAGLMRDTGVKIPSKPLSLLTLLKALSGMKADNIALYTMMRR